MSVISGDRLKADLRWNVSGIGLAANIFQCRVYQEIPHAISDVWALGDIENWLERILEPMEPHVIVTATVTPSPVYKWIVDEWNLLGTVDPSFTSESIGDPLPSGVAALITVYTAISRVQGKKYMPALSEVAASGGVWVAGVISALADCAGEWLTPFLGPSDPTTLYVPGVYSSKTSSFQDFVLETLIKDIPSYQRRRKEGVGT